MKTSKKKLYVLIDESLNPVYGCVQGGHAVAQWLLEHPNQSWNNSYLIYLYCNIGYWKEKLINKNIQFTIFNETDLNNKTTAIALENDGKIFKKLKLVA